MRYAIGYAIIYQELSGKKGCSLTLLKRKPEFKGTPQIISTKAGASLEKWHGKGIELIARG